MLLVSPRPTASVQLFQRMMHDILTGGQTTDPIDQVCWHELQDSAPSWIVMLVALA